MSSGPLAVAPFRRLAIGWTFSNFGDSLLYLSLAIWTKDLTGSDAAAGLVLLFLGLPVLLAPIAGYLADRFPRRRLVTVANLVAAVGVLSLVFVKDAGDVWLIYLVTFGYGFVTYVTSACASGLVADMLPEEHLAGANGLLSTIDQGLRLLSPLAGAAVYTLIGGGAIAATTSAMLVIAALIVATIDFVESPPTPAEDRESFWNELTAGARHMRRTPILARLTLFVAVAVGVTGVLNSTIFASVEQGLGRSSTFLGILLSIQGGGSVIGGVTAAAVIRRLGEKTALGVGLVVMAVGLSATMTSSTVVMCAGVFALGVSIPWEIVAFATLRQRLTPLPLQGRVSAAANLALNAPQSLGTATGAALIASVDYRILVGVMVAVIAACGLAIMGSRVAAVSMTAATAAQPARSAHERSVNENSCQPATSGMAP